MKNVVQKVRGNYQKFSDRDFLVLAQTVEKAMIGNLNFTEIETLLSALNTSLMEYSAKLAASSKRGSPEDTAIKNLSRKKLENAITNLAYHVNKVSNGRLSVLLSSGFILAKPSRLASIPNMVTGLKMRDGRQRGQIILSFDAQKSIRLYNYRYTKDVDASGQILWTGKELVTSTSKNNIIAAITPGATYYISVQAANAAGMGDWSEPVSWIAR